MPGSASRSPGRPAGRSDARTSILTAAKECFTTHGYQEATLRMVATEAGVDPALVSHYFGSKEGLFEAALHDAPAPLRAVRFALDGADVDVAARLAQAFTEQWEDPKSGPWLRTVVRAAAISPAAANRVAAFMTDSVLNELGHGTRCADPEVRAALVGAQLLGIAMTRYVLRLPPLVDLDRDQLVAMITPMIQQCLTGDSPVAGG